MSNEFLEKLALREQEEKTAREIYQRACDARAYAERDYASSILSEITLQARARWGENFVRARVGLQDWMPDGGTPDAFINIVLKIVNEEDYWDWRTSPVFMGVGIVDEEQDGQVYLEIDRFI